MSGPLLRVEELAVGFQGDGPEVHAVDGVSFDVAAGEAVALVGESGCGKSASALALMGLLPKPGGRVRAGRVVFDGRDLVPLPESELRHLRGRRMAMIFQDPMTSLNPYLRIDEQLAEVAQLHLGLGRRAAVGRAVELLDRVGIPDPATRVRAFPHELSGGQRQRVMIAMALLCDPDLLIADEPTTALDVTVQGQILSLLRELREERDLALLLITHDLAVVAGTCDRVLVMYAGQLVEEAATRDLFRRPGHPYTEALLGAVPRIDRPPLQRLVGLEGLPPRLDRGPFDACRFAPRCARVRDACRAGEPALEPMPGESGPAGRRRCVVPLEELR